MVTLSNIKVIAEIYLPDKLLKSNCWLYVNVNDGPIYQGSLKTYSTRISDLKGVHHSPTRNFHPDWNISHSTCHSGQKQCLNVYGITDCSLRLHQPTTDSFPKVSITPCHGHEGLSVGFHQRTTPVGCMVFGTAEKSEVCAYWMLIKMIICAVMVRIIKQRIRKSCLWHRKILKSALD